MEDLIPNDGCVITITKGGFIKELVWKNSDFKTAVEKALLEVVKKKRTQ